MLDGDVGSSTRADIFEKAHPDRYLQMGIAEQNMLGVAAGLATMGLVPFISTFVSFAVVRPLDQVRVLIAQTGANVKITPGYAGLFTGQTGMSHIIVDDMAIMRAMPGMVTVSPADDVEAAQVLRWAAAYEGPGYVRLVRDATPRVFGDDHVFAFGKAEVVREGSDVTLITTGAQTPRTVEAAELLAAEGIEAHVLHVATLKPLDVGGDRGRGGADRPRDHGRGAHRHRRPRRRGGGDAGRASPDAGGPDRAPGRVRAVGSERRAARHLRAVRGAGGRAGPGAALGLTGTGRAVRRRLAGRRRPGPPAARQVLGGLVEVVPERGLDGSASRAGRPRGSARGGPPSTARPRPAPGA